MILGNKRLYCGEKLW